MSSGIYDGLTTISDSNRICVELLISDVNLALTFLDLAETTNRAEDRARRIQEATQAYQATLSFLPRLTPTEEQKDALTRDLATLRKRLQATGAVCEDSDGCHQSPN